MIEQLTQRQIHSPKAAWNGGRNLECSAVPYGTNLYFSYLGCFLFFLQMQCKEKCHQQSLIRHAGGMYCGRLPTILVEKAYK